MRTAVRWKSLLAATVHPLSSHQEPY